MEQENIGLRFDTNAKEIAKDVNNLGNALEETTNSTTKNNNEVEKGEQSYKSFKTQLREANQELQKQIQLYGETSAETIKAAKAVAGLKDQMEFAQDISKQFNPDQKMKALGAATNVAGTGLQGVTAGMALFGDQSKDTQAQLLKVQAAMAFSDAISNLSNIGDQFAILKTTVKDVWRGLTTAKVIDSTATAVNTTAVLANTTAVGVETTAVAGSTIATTAATVATNLWNASLAIALAPITLIVAGVSALVLGIGYLTGAFGDFNGEQLKGEINTKRLNDSLNDQTKFFEKHNKEVLQRNKNIYDLAKANGQSDASLRKLEKSLLDVEIAQKRTNAVNLYAILIETKKALSLDSTNEKLIEANKKAYDAYIVGNGIYNDSLTARKQLSVKHEIEIATATNQAKEKSRGERKAVNKKRKADDDALARKRKDDQLARDMQSAKDALKIVDDLEKSKETPAQKEEREYLEKKAVLEKNNLSTIALTEAYNLKLAETEANLEKLKQDGKRALMLDQKQYEIDNEIDPIKKKELELEFLTTSYEDEKAILEEQLKDKILTKEKEIELNNQLDLLALNYKQSVADKEKEIEENKVNEKKKNQASLKRLGETALSATKNLFSKNKEIQKAAVIVDAAVTTGKVIKGTISAVKDANAASPLTFGLPWSAVHIAQGGLELASIVNSTNQQLQALGGGGSASGGGGSMPSVGGGASPQASPTVNFNNTSENQIGQTVARNTNEQPPIRVFVAENDITTAQNSVQVLVDVNKI